MEHNTHITKLLDLESGRFCQCHCTRPPRCRVVPTETEHTCAVTCTAEYTLMMCSFNDTNCDQEGKQQSMKKKRMRGREREGGRERGGGGGGAR